MRYKKGSKVEVLRKNEVPSGSWRYAEIICGNGHNYTVRYDMYPGAAVDAIVERVSRKSIRPCPPVVELSENWIPGDVVEVFHNFSWKMATLSKVSGRNCFLVRLLGSSQEFKVSKFDLRVRQSWQDDKWFIIGKGLENCEDAKYTEQSTLKYNHNLSSQNRRTDTRNNFQIEHDSFAVKTNINCQDSHIVSSRNLKRGSSYLYSQVEALAGTAKKFRVIENEGRHHYVVAANTSVMPEKVDVVASPQEMLDEKHLYASFNNRIIRFPEMDGEREKPNVTVGCSRAISVEPNDADNVTCSVGSCSISGNNSFKLHRVEDTEGHFSDAESVCQWGHEDGNCPLPTKEELAAEIHRLELNAYHCTLEALHASGPLSWEQETLVTDLRISLHISNDEHLTELRNLISTATSIPIS